MTIDDTNEENDILFPTIDDNKNVVYKDEKNEDEEDVELKKRSNSSLFYPVSKSGKIGNQECCGI